MEFCLLAILKCSLYSKYAKFQLNINILRPENYEKII